MKPETKAAWVKALRGGKFRQTCSILKRTSGGQSYHCCIGVLLEINGLSTKGKTIRGDDSAYLGLDEESRVALECLNDGVKHPDHNPNGVRLSFEDIAKYIEAKL